jgi:hypothetical protein
MELSTSSILKSVGKFFKVEGGAKKKSKKRSSQKKGGTSGRTVQKKLVEVKSRMYSVNKNRTPYNPYGRFAHVPMRRVSPVREDDNEDLADLFGRMHTSAMSHKKAKTAMKKHVLPSIDDLADMFGRIHTSSVAHKKASKAISGVSKSIKKSSARVDRMNLEPTRRSTRASKTPAKLSTSSKGKSYKIK